MIGVGLCRLAIRGGSVMVQRSGQYRLAERDGRKIEERESLFPPIFLYLF